MDVRHCSIIREVKQNKRESVNGEHNFQPLGVYINLQSFMQIPLQNLGPLGMGRRKTERPGLVGNKVPLTVVLE